MKKKIVIRKLFRLGWEECGAELVEFAMSALLLMATMVCVIGFAMAMYTYHFVSFAAQEGVRFAMVHGYTWSETTTTNCSTSGTNFTMVYGCTASTADVQNYVRSLVTGGIIASNLTAVTTWPGTTPNGSSTLCAQAKTEGCLVKVKVTYTYNFFKVLPLPKAAWSLIATSEGAVVQ